MIEDFYNIEKIEHERREMEFKVRFNAEHRIFKAHFPSNPVVPGVCLLQICTNILLSNFSYKLKLNKVVNIKFKHPITPELEPLFIFNKIKQEGEFLNVSLSVEVENVQYAKLQLGYINTNWSLIIPTFNNEKTIGKVVEDVSKYSSDIIVVNDGSTDSSTTILKELEGKVVVVSHSENKGKGAALLSGFAKAKELGFKYAITIDADSQHFADDIPKFLEKLKTSPNSIIVGSRNLMEENMPKQNTFANKFSNFWFRVQTGVNLSDTQSGYRLYPLSCLRGLNLITSRYEAELELLVFSSWSGVKIEQVPIKVYYPPKGERVSHFRPVYDFVRISILNTLLCFGAIFYAFPYRIIRFIFK